MKIIIVGCGKVGTAIATELNAEDHEIVVVDINREAVTRLSDSLDVLGIEGNGAIYETLEEAGAGNADLVIAAAARDEVNLYTCLMSKACGAHNTIARVRNPEYAGDLFRVKDLMGLSMFINPEQTAALEISRMLRFSGALEIDSFSKGMVDLIKFEIYRGGALDGKAISKIDNLKGTVRICTIERGNDVFIPNGDFVIQAGDRVSIVARTESAVRFVKKINVSVGKGRSIFLLGGGKISYYLAQRLLRSGVNVKIIEHNPDRCNELAEALHGAVIIQGDCMDQDLLHSEGIEHADGVAALMDYDEENILISMYIKSISKAKVITKVNNAYFDSLVSQIGLDTVINPKHIAGEYIARYIRAMQNSLGSNVETLYRLSNDRVEALEFRARSSSRLLNTPLSKLNLRDDLQVICIARGGKVILPTGSDVIMADDSVVVVTKHKGLSDLDDILSRR